CYPIAALGVYLLARALRLPRTAATFCALAFALSGVMVSQSVSLQYLGAFSRAPFAIWAALRLAQSGRARFAAALGVALASILWSGDPEVLLIDVLICAAIVLRSRRNAAIFVIAGATALLLCAPLLLPALHAFSGSARTGALDLDEALQWSLHPI